MTQPKTSDEALQAIESFLALPGLTVLPVPSDLVPRWAQLLRQAPVVRKRAFDTQLIAIMQSSSVATVYTYNTADFVGYPGITVLEPPVESAPVTS